MVFICLPEMKFVIRLEISEPWLVGFGEDVGIKVAHMEELEPEGVLKIGLSAAVKGGMPANCAMASKAGLFTTSLMRIAVTSPA